MKHVDELESKSVGASIVTSLLHMTMIGTKNHGVGFENKLGPFSLHDASRSSLVVLADIRHARFLTH
jgi:hypothetical protein